mgnify:CR=1 FL=1
MELRVGYYNEHVFNINVVAGIICFIVLVVILAYWIHKRK